MEAKSFIFAIVAVTVVLLLFIGFIISLLLLFQKRRQQHKLDLATAEAEFSQTLLATQIEIQEQTLNHISHELHDNISQKLGLAKLQLYHLQQTGKLEEIAQVKEVIVEAIGEVRSLSRSLHPEKIASQSLKDSIDQEVYRLIKTGAFTINAAIDEEDNLTEEQRIFLFRIVQELMNNAVKYAEASVLTISFKSTPGVMLTVEDNGVGLPTDYKPGLGLTGIQSRVKLLQGSFSIESVPGMGTKAVVEL